MKRLTAETMKEDRIEVPDSMMHWSPAELGENERIDPSDGMPHCIICGERTAMRVRMPFHGGKYMTVACMCRCRREEEAAWRAEQEDKERMRRIEQKRAAGLQDACLKNYRFENSRSESRGLTKARMYAERFLHPEEEDPAGLVFFGPVGTGKTFAAGCIANELIDHNIPVLMTSFPKLLSLAWSSEESWLERVESLNDYRLLILDDFGVERETAYALEKVYYVIDERYKSGKPFILTTNLTMDEIRHPKDLMRQRIYDRIRERCGFVLFHETNYRLQNAEKTHTELRNALSGEDSRPKTGTSSSADEEESQDSKPERAMDAEPFGEAAEGRRV